MLQMLMLELPRIALGEKIDEFAFFVQDFDENGDATNANPKIAHFLKTQNSQLGEYSAEDNSLLPIGDYGTKYYPHYQLSQVFKGLKAPESKLEKKIKVNHFFFDTYTLMLG